MSTRQFMPSQEFTNSLRDQLVNFPYAPCVFQTPDGQRWAISGVMVHCAHTADLGTIMCTLEKQYAV